MSYFIVACTSTSSGEHVDACVVKDGKHGINCWVCSISELDLIHDSDS